MALSYMNIQKRKLILIIRASLNKLRKMGSKLLLQSSSRESCCMQWFKQRKVVQQTACNQKRSLDVPKDVPKGHMVVYVGENVRRFVIKISLLKHPLFRALLDMARDEHDDSTTPLKLWIPCDEAMFVDVVRCAGSPSDYRSCLQGIGVFCL